MSKLAVVAIGGNSLIKDPKYPEMTRQWDAIRETAHHIANLTEDGWNVVIAHGNGPQVGYILRRTELAAHEVHGVTLDIIVADTQGSIGYMIQQTLQNEFVHRTIDKDIVSIVTQVLVDRDDPAFANPTKPIGGFLTTEDAKRFESEGWVVVEDAGRGLRRVVASPEPLAVVEIEAIRTLLKAGFVIVAAGGGGIPVLQNTKGELRGSYAVIDKDRAAALLANTLGADLFIISTGVEKVAINFNTPVQQNLDHMTPEECEHYLEEGHFAPGSMKPKIQAVKAFIEHGGDHALITNPENLARALAGETGTHITSSE